MNEKSRPTPTPQPRVPNGHGYCWASHDKTGGRCAQPKGHSGKHVDPYTPGASW